MKNCICGFSYNNKNDLEVVNLIETKGIIKYYCPCCKKYKYTENLNK